MRIAQITPGNIPIPTSGWGAVEKIIWEYTKVLRNLGHEVEILYTDDVRAGEWDVVHVHMANLALILKSRGIPYIFSHHDHHAYHFGVDSDVYKQNLEAIEGSQLSFVHAKYLVEFFGSPKKLRYLGHGANIGDYDFIDRSREVSQGHVKLLMMANNGLGGDSNYDRKGFVPGIEAARKLDLPITLICPSKGNQEFISTIKPYEKLNVLYDLEYGITLKEMASHHIFLNPSMLEAGHPNLTVTESIARGIPVAGTMEEEIPGTRRIGLPDNLMVSSDELANSISEIISKYSSYVMECKNQREIFSWEVVVSRMLMDYSNYLKIGQENLLLDTYKSTKKRLNNKSENSGFYSWFKKLPILYKTRKMSTGSSVSFIDKITGEIIHKSDLLKEARAWDKPKPDFRRYIDWRIVVKEGAMIIYQHDMDLLGQHVLVRGASKSNLADLIKFSDLTGSIITVDSDDDLPFFRLVEKTADNFYLEINIEQVLDFFSARNKIPERTLISLGTESLGDNIAFIPYANEYGRKNGIVVDVLCRHSELFIGMYENVNFVNNRDEKKYTSYININYLFDVPLQRGFSDQLLLDYTEIRPRVRKSSDNRNDIRGKYVCFSMHSTTQAKHWNNNNSWFKLCAELRKHGLIPVCIDRHYSFGTEGYWNEIPSNCVNKTGGDLNSMSGLIENCEFFIGLSSGLSWIAHALGKGVVMISGVTTVDNEFTKDCIRLHRTDVCNSCFNKPHEYIFNSGDWLWCPEHKGTSRAFECTKKISAKQVMDALRANKWI
jgi:autotransporter strand-loop-strand O-heptosyltransferase